MERPSRMQVTVLEKVIGRRRRAGRLFWEAPTLFAVTLALALCCGCSSGQNPQSPEATVEKPAASQPAQTAAQAAPTSSQPTPASPAATPADFANYTEAVPGTKISFEMIAVPGGAVLMGSADSESGRKQDEGPQHEVTLSPFWIGKVEVTWDEYDAFRDACPPIPRGTPESQEDIDGISGPTPPYGDPYRGFGGGKQPAIGMSWHAAMTYCMWLSKVTGKLYRLPTEAEWEYACRAGSKAVFCFGDDPANLGEYTWLRANSEYETHPIATKKPNAWGIHDMHGNVSEWCLDWYQPDYYGSVTSGTWPPDPRGPETGRNHAIRGGNFSQAPALQRCAARDCSRDVWLTADPQEPKSKWWLVPTNYLGFRIVRPLREEKSPVRQSRRGL